MLLLHSIVTALSVTSLPKFTVTVPSFRCARGCMLKTSALCFSGLGRLFAWLRLWRREQSCAWKRKLPHSWTSQISYTEFRFLATLFLSGSSSLRFRSRATKEEQKEDEAGRIRSARNILAQDHLWLIAWLPESTGGRLSKKGSPVDELPPWLLPFRRTRF